MINTVLRRSVRLGLLFGVVALSVSVIGMVQSFNERDIITGVLTLGQLLLFSTAFLAGYMTPREESPASPLTNALGGLVAGAITALPLVGLIGLYQIWPDIRDSLVNVSPALMQILTMGQEDPLTGALMLSAVMVGLGLLGAVLHLLPLRVRKPLVAGLAFSLALGLLSEILLNVLRQYLDRSILNVLFGSKGIQPAVAVVAFVLAAAWTAVWDAWLGQRYRARRDALSVKQQTTVRRGSIALGIIIVLLLPSVLGVYLSEVLDVVGIFVLMGLGLNIVVGFAGLLDLGYVAFFAIGAYTMGLLTSQGELGIANFSFWAALPFSILAAVFFGIILGVPVLRMRGDYLAIVTLGFGEIIRVLAASDLLKSYIGGAQGILQISRPRIFDFVLVQPQEFYYLILAGILLALFVSWRLRDARLGRRWMAVREDEDVAEAMGVHLVSTKLLAFAIGAAFSGLAGAIFASRLASIFPHSFQLLISINVLSLIIIGGLGSLPGVVVGALLLIGLPELLREFQEYRLLLYGALLIATMLVRPEGLWPSPIRQRELHAEEEEAALEGPLHEEVAELV
ncbi:MAG: branched-chain amino acid ABC transporter permease [Candidatus Promineifilaceae bacterium]